jgi:hypothetical protein
MAYGLGGESATLTAATLLDWCKPPSLRADLESIVSASWVEKKLRAIRERMARQGCEQFKPDAQGRKAA